MEVKIGVQYAARELSVATDSEPQAVLDALSKAIADDSVLALTDEKGRRFLVQTSKIAYVEIGAPGSDRRIGFAGG